MLTTLLLTSLCSCSPPAEPAGGLLDFALTNFTGGPLSRIYLSPQDSAEWGEDILRGQGLSAGDSIDIRFSPEEQSPLWDLRVEAAGGYCAEWKGLDLRAANRITLRLKLFGEKVAVAEVE